MMDMKRLAAALTVFAVLAPAAAQAQSKLNAGPYGNTKFEFTSRGSSSTTSADGTLTVTADSINTINCNGCDRREFYPGYLYNIRNNTKKPLCFSFHLTLDAGSYNGVTSWGSGQVFMIKGGQTLQRFAGVTMDFGYRRVNLRHTYKFGGWPPVDKRNCGPDRLKV